MWNGRVIVVLFSVLALGSTVSGQDGALRFDFGPGAVATGWRQVLPEIVYSDDAGFGFEPGASVQGVERAGGDALTGDFCAGNQPFFFSAAVPKEGNYRVTVTLGDRQGESSTTIKAELRRLMIEEVQTVTGQIATVNFIVNTRIPRIAAVDDIRAGAVRLKTPRETTQEAWAWDNLLTLEFNGARPAVCAVEIVPVEVPTVFVLGDSTVCDQSTEPYTSWGQMLTRFFKSTVAIANHGESGESYSASLGRRRIDKIASLMKPGDYLLMQFGHNDQKERGENVGPFLNHKDNIKRHIVMVRSRGGVPVIISPMERRRFDNEGKVAPSLADYAEASRQAAREEGVAFIDLNAMSVKFYEAMGPEKSAEAFAAPGGRQDNTHHNNYGAYELAKCIVQGIRDNKLEIAEHIVDGFAEFDPARPDPMETFALPPSPERTTQRPLGD